VERDRMYKGQSMVPPTNAAEGDDEKRGTETVCRRAYFAEKAHKPNQETAAAPVNPKQDSPVPSQSQRESQHAQQHHTMMTKQQNEDDDKDELRLRYREYALAIPFLHTVRRQHDLPSASAIAFRVGLCRLVECVHPSHQQIHANPAMRPLDATGPRWRSGQRNWQQ